MSYKSGVELRGFITQFSKFGLVGVLTTTFGIVCYYILLERMALPLYPVYISIFLVGVLISYLLNSHFTFHKKTNLKDSIRYYTSYLVGLVVGLILLYIFERTLEYSDFILTILIIPPRFLLTFLLVKKVVFTEQTQ